MRATHLIPVLFVLIWPTGFVGAKFGLPYAEPLTFLAMRFGIAAILLWAVVFLFATPRLSASDAPGQAATGILVHALYLGGVFVAISWGLEAGVSALILGLQPIVTALLARWFLAERLSFLQWVGMVLGLAGVILIVLRKLDQGLGTPAAVGVCVFGLFAIALGSILQKRSSNDVPMISGNAVQFAAASAICALGAALFETGEIRPEPEFFAALTWMVVVLSFGAITLLYIMIRNDSASQVASLFFLVPPITALFAWAMFGETMYPIEIAGLVATAIGVLLVRQPGKQRA